MYIYVCQSYKMGTSTNYAGSVIQTFDYKKLNSAEQISAQETGWLEEKIQDFY